LNLLAVVNSLVANAFDPIVVFKNIFEGLGTLPDTFLIYMIKKEAEPRCLYPLLSYISWSKDQSEARIRCYGVIEPVEQPTEWCSALTIAPQAGGKRKMCVDLTS